jgi:surface polysaccharide O-acyltransferase-like enzyme
MTVQTPTRYFAMDALRATALLIGIFFHAVWSFIPVYFVAPIVDTSTSYIFLAFFYFTHIFRMQVFFLIAGFFARLVLHRKGVPSFILQRLSRIGIPLIIGWMLLFPINKFVWLWGGINSGRVTSDTSLWEEFALQMNTFFTSGAGFDFNHLWFLYYLLIIYALLLIIRAVVIILDRKGAIQPGLDHVFRWFINSNWGILILAFPTAIMLRTMILMWGVGESSAFLIPDLEITTIYTMFFVVN